MPMRCSIMRIRCSGVAGGCPTALYRMVRRGDYPFERLRCWCAAFGARNRICESHWRCWVVERLPCVEPVTFHAVGHREGSGRGALTPTFVQRALWPLAAPGRFAVALALGCAGRRLTPAIDRQATAAAGQWGARAFRPGSTPQRGIDAHGPADVAEGSLAAPQVSAQIAEQGAARGGEPLRPVDKRALLVVLDQY